MGKGRSHGWSVFDTIKAFPSSPEALMAEIDAAIAAVEYGHATALLSSSSSSPFPPIAAETNNAVSSAFGPRGSSHDARLAEESYRAACSALATGRPDAALRSIRVALASCPPDKTSAVAKLRSLSSIASSQLQKQNQQHQQHSPLL
ncbi:uncharacterized protein LOC110115567 [Dendrobium catenatum]|uniref:Uncharacterized protein n=1 Tax=Dendrobium catenatum TaxID=906689 RepID=A0A2I0XHA7_9ASPA|nr:uncharacterized protein LOC110115567 [Dendrobium catenatum]PKU87295.1 hypothetical protein MA16_Dca024328 [Dendrobium catenatum]